ncbi:glia-derived nexin [Synchiropus splendidus]|uniref:glia-derived nexin n=1 Tax=Synchiropus splendidus TaxID=270530 RepID=UPI00237DF9DE|nr:glia-derived nexin [Synchiropus splendidus]
MRRCLLFTCLYVLLTANGFLAVLSQALSYGERGSNLGVQVFQQVVLSKPLENVVMSPHGVASILGMLLPGADGETRKQFLNALRYKKNGPYKMLKKLHKLLTAKSNQESVLIANGMFAQEGFPMEEAFVDTNKANFNCESRNLDFSDTQEAAHIINQWVSNKTKGEISGLVKADMLDSALTRLVAVNSIFFKGLWKSRFQPENTKMRTFTAGNGNVYKVPTMSQLSLFNIGLPSTPDGIKYRVIQLPYQGNVFCMLIVVPVDEGTPLSAVIPHISMSTVQGWTKSMGMKKVRLFIPKFTAEAEVDLKDPLQALGVTDMFDAERADFRHLSSESVHVSKALQKAKIEVNEDGTKAAAATSAILMARSSPPWINVDRPFLFLIRHNPTGTILFMGQINEP